MVRERSKGRCRLGGGEGAGLAAELEAFAGEEADGFVVDGLRGLGDEVEHAGGLFGVGRGEGVELGELADDGGARREGVEVAAEDFLADGERGRGDLQGEVEAAQEGGVDVVDVVGDPDGGGGVFFEDAVGPSFGFGGAGAKQGGEVVDRGEDVFGFIKEDQGDVFSAEEALAEHVGAEAVVAVAGVAVFILGVDFVEGDAGGGGEGAGELGFAGARGAVEEHVGA